MPQTIGNPGTWLASAFGLAGRHAADSAQALGSEDTTPPRTRQLTNQDLREALSAGWHDFQQCRTDVMFLVLLYPVIGIVLALAALNMDLVPLIFPLIAGFALLGPVSAVGVYEISRRREQGEEIGWLGALKVVESPRFASILVMGIYLAVIFCLWLVVAGHLYGATLGPEAPASIGTFLGGLATGPGLVMIVLGCAIGGVFALAVLATSVVSFPLLLDRAVGLPVAVLTSIRVTRENPRVILTWGAIVTLGLVLGSIPALIGLVIVLPVLGHATWHLYRRAVA
ncbi:DUF2189 domain-containing protein [Mameliella sp. AT18]|uniref:DUF2189 domain-containing protein n=1 Tax=Mameliella TaxID=1434019 RepID=UPI000841199B|nr:MULTISPECIES: DUF2189 domain-containing protein [Mameliella]MCR9275355.1 DUF2189 domain-containing protein [Paracoccaceae bacterium]MDD9728357.1 DUF2189 domain-containing protein [Mameliella sp. AT18]ODM50140.1 hypothetical protein A9320_12445 [Ruegeria sp. PBVC088]OWV61080.1 hypothetical protein CDZ98_08595 [Mameliella alba]